MLTLKHFNMKTLFTFFTTTALLLSISSNAQKTVSISARYGINTIGLSGTVYLPYSGAIEALFTISHDNNRVLLTSMYENYIPLGNKKNFVLYAGAGLHAGYKKTTSIEYTEVVKYEVGIEMQESTITKKTLITGADAIVGMNYNIPSSSLYVGLDFKPNVDFINGHSMMVDGGVRFGISF